jgi:hypothetical protein
MTGFRFVHQELQGEEGHLGLAPCVGNAASTGRLRLDVLLWFAQTQREVTGERMPSPEILFPPGKRIRLNGIRRDFAG